MLSRYTGRARGFLDKYVPPFSFYRPLQFTSFLISFSSLFDSGKSAVDGIKILYDNSNSYLKSHLGKMLSSGHRQKGLDEMLDTGLIDQETMAKIAMAFKLPNFSHLLSFVAKSSIDHTERKLSRIGNVNSVCIDACSCSNFITYCSFNPSGSSRVPWVC